ncbi:DNA excision repair protein ERCC-6-like [Halotydeus destructor]|nr:DNA excision repair protein ERCC-6-like [Halotydeus destructor]
MTDSDEDFSFVENRDRAEKLYNEAKKCVKAEQNSKTINKALAKIIQANKLFPNEKYEKRITALNEFLLQMTKDDSDSDLEILHHSRGNVSKTENNSPSTSKDISGPPVIIDVNANSVSAKTERDDDVQIQASTVSNNPKSKYVDIQGHKVLRKVYEKLYEYQVEGLKWMLKLYDTAVNHKGPDCNFAKGCVLADDMGLGKTVQTITLLCTLLMEENIEKVLIVAPVSLLINWAKEFKHWYRNSVDVLDFHEGSKQRRLQNLRHVQRNGGVLLTTYDLARNFDHEMNNLGSKKFTWDYLVLDEAHKIKNPTKTSKSLQEFRSYFRLAITGTPVQNNLRELHAIYHFVNGCLGPYPSFKSSFEIPIQRSREKNATEYEKKTGTLLAENLRKEYQMYFKRRTKEEVFSRRNSIGGDSKLNLFLPTKYDWVVWVTLTDFQVVLYKDFLKTDSVVDIVRGDDKRSALVQLTDLKKLCDHPRRMPKSVINELKETSMNESGLASGVDANGVDIESIDTETLLNESSKVGVLLSLLQCLRSEGHRTLVFSMSTLMLDIIQKVLTVHRFKMARLDGRVRKMAERDKIVRTFQEDTSYEVCLLTTQVGGVGLTLTAADRVVIYDPSWNPATDSQAVDRVYRIGQKKHVVVYRLITCGTVEEKIFRRQVFKRSIINQMVQSEHDPTRYFTNQDLRELFQFNDHTKAETCDLIESMHGHQRKQCGTTDIHRGFVGNLDHVYGISDHDFLFSNKEGEVADDVGDVEIIEIVSKATQNLRLGSEALNELEIRPLALRVPDRNRDKEKLRLPEIPNPTIITVEDTYIEKVSDFIDTSVVNLASDVEDNALAENSEVSGDDDNEANNSDPVGQAITGDTDVSDDNESVGSLDHFIDDNGSEDNEATDVEEDVETNTEKKDSPSQSSVLNSVPSSVDRSHISEDVADSLDDSQTDGSLVSNAKSVISEEAGLSDFEDNTAPLESTRIHNDKGDVDRLSKLIKHSVIIAEDGPNDSILVSGDEDEDCLEVFEPIVEDEADTLEERKSPLIFSDDTKFVLKPSFFKSPSLSIAESNQTRKSSQKQDATKDIDISQLINQDMSQEATVKIENMSSDSISANSLVKTEGSACTSTVVSPMPDSKYIKMETEQDSDVSDSEIDLNLPQVTQFELRPSLLQSPTISFIDDHATESNINSSSTGCYLKPENASSSGTMQSRLKNEPNFLQPSILNSPVCVPIPANAAASTAEVDITQNSPQLQQVLVPQILHSIQHQTLSGISVTTEKNMPNSVSRNGSSEMVAHPESPPKCLAPADEPSTPATVSNLSVNDVYDTPFVTLRKKVSKKQQELDDISDVHASIYESPMIYMPPLSNQNGGSNCKTVTPLVAGKNGSGLKQSTTPESKLSRSSQLKSIVSPVDIDKQHNSIVSLCSDESDPDSDVVEIKPSSSDSAESVADNQRRSPLIFETEKLPLLLLRGNQVKRGPLTPTISSPALVGDMSFALAETSTPKTPLRRNQRLRKRIKTNFSDT